MHRRERRREDHQHIGRQKLVMRWLCGVLFVAAGANHFLHSAFYVRIMPPYLPWHLELVYLSGLCEMVLGALILVPRYQVPAAWGLIALLVAVFPANLHMTLHADLFPAFSPAILWARLPFQALLIAWVHWFTRRPVGVRYTARPVGVDDTDFFTQHGSV